MKKRFLKCFLFLLLAVVFAGCAGKDSGEGLTLAISSTPQTVDPQLAADTSSGFVIPFFASCLYQYDENKDLVPCLANSYDLSEDGLTYTFHLKKGLVFSNGSPITAADFVLAFQRLADPKVGSNSLYLITSCCKIKNVDDVSTGKRPVTQLGVHAIDYDTLVVELEYPCPYFCGLLTMVNFSPCDVDFYHETGVNYASSDDTTISSGPYIMDRYEPLATQIHFIKNPNYYDADKITVPEITLQVVQNGQQGLMCYESDNVDFTQISGELIELAEGDPDLQVFPCASMFYLEIAQRKNEDLKNKNIRMALSKSIDREDITKNILRTGANPMTRVIPPEFYDETDGSDFAGDTGRYDEYAAYDPEKAVQLWNEGLKEIGKSELTLSFVFVASQNSVMEALKAQMEKTLPGLTLQLKTITAKDLAKTRMEGGYDLLFYGWNADYADPTSFLELFLSDDNETAYSNPEFDETYKKCGSQEIANDPEERNKLLHKAEDIIMEDAGMIPLFNRGNTYLIRQEMKGYQMVPTGGAPVVIGLEKEVK